MNEILENLEKAILQYDRAGAELWARKAIKAKIDPVNAMESLKSAIRQVGDGYGRGDLWLPDLVGAASAMQSAMPIIDEALKKKYEKTRESGASCYRDGLWRYP